MNTMTIISLTFGILLNLVGLISFYLSGASHPHTLLSCLLGLIIIGCALLSRDPKFHRRGMQGASLTALVGMGATAFSLLQLPLVLHKHAEPLGNLAIIILAKNATFLLCLILLTRYFQEFLVSRSKKK